MRQWRGSIAGDATIVAMALVVSSACGDSTGSSGMTDSVATARAQIVAKINQLRATGSLPALTEWTAGETCADGEATTDAAANQAHSAFGSCGESAQNECPSWPALAQIATGCVQAMWDEGPGPFATHGHYINMSSTSYGKVAVGIALTSSGKVWTVLNFAP